MGHLPAECVLAVPCQVMDMVVLFVSVRPHAVSRVET